MLDKVKKSMTLEKKKSDEILSIITAMKAAANHSQANHGYMLRLLEAEWKSVTADSCDGAAVAVLYEVAIAAARDCKLINAQGLACEKAGFHHKRAKDAQSAAKYFKQARECYEKWGSNVKVAFVQRELDALEELH